SGSKIRLVFKAKLDKELRRGSYEQLALYGMIHLEKGLIDIKKQIHLVSKNSQIRIYNKAEACVKSIPPVLETDAYDAPLGSSESHDIEFARENTYEPS